MITVVGRTRTAEKIFVVGASRRMVDVDVDRDDVDVLQSDVDADAGLAEPEEVRHLLRVGDVVGRLELARTVQVLEERSTAV